MSLKHNPALFLNLSDCLVQGAVEGGVPEGVCGDLVLAGKIIVGVEVGRGSSWAEIPYGVVDEEEVDIGEGGA